MLFVIQPVFDLLDEAVSHEELFILFQEGCAVICFYRTGGADGSLSYLSD